jgi:hypothetical protein
MVGQHFGRLFQKIIWSPWFGVRSKTKRGLDSNENHVLRHGFEVRPFQLPPNNPAGFDLTTHNSASTDDITIRSRLFNLLLRANFDPRGWNWPLGLKNLCSTLHSSLDVNVFTSKRVKTLNLRGNVQPYGSKLTPGENACSKLWRPARDCR